ncbi:MAG: PNGase F N-terminal domain-containing protein [Bacteroidota bacterium]
MTIKSLVFFLFSSIGALAQERAVVLTYAQMGEDGPRENTTKVIVYKGVAKVGETRNDLSAFIDYNRKERVEILYENGIPYKTVTPFDSLPQALKEESTPDKILGYTAKKSTYTSFSNTIEVWVTTEANFSGTMYPRVAPMENALVLKLRFNGGTTYVLQSIEKQKGKVSAFDYEYDKSSTITDDIMEEKKIESRYITVKVFDNQMVNFDPKIEIDTSNYLLADKTYQFSKGSVVLKKIKLDQELLKDSRVFATLHCRSDGDAYDRTGSVFVIPANGNKTTMLDAFQHGLDVLPVMKDEAGRNYQGVRATDDYDPPIEIMRFFTSFGAGHFNDKRVIHNYPWVNDVRYKEDVTEVFPEADSLWVGVFIGNYVKNGHMVSLDLNFYPSFQDEEDSTRKFVQPLFLTVNTMEMSGQNYGRFFKTDSLTVSFNVPENTQNMSLYFTTTGHGGWGGGDEFNPKLNQVFVDGNQVFEVVPWRTDCGTYRFSNPASGNFGNGMSSSDLSRSNWCPGTLTPPYIIPLDGLAPGEHIMTVSIDQGEDTANGFSHWGVSGVLVGEMVE